MSKKLKEYINKIMQLGLLVDYDIDDSLMNEEIDCVSYNSKELFGKSIFVCKGINFKEKYVFDAFSNGAIVYIAEKQVKNLNNCILVSDIRRLIENIALFHYDYPADKITTIAITGTKGKSTVAYMVKNILDSYLSEIGEKPAGLISSIHTFDGVDDFESNLTTPEPLELQKYYYNMVNSDIKYCVTEVSSQALKYGRTYGVPFKVACFNNFGEDHISSSEHENVQDYFESKLKIFNNAEIACVNGDCEVFENVLDFAKDKCDVFTFGRNKTFDVFCSHYKVYENKILLTVNTEYYKSDLILNIAGEFNIENALAAITISNALKIPLKHICNGLLNVDVPGRMKVLSTEDNKISIVVDYAHNQLSYESLFNYIKSHYKDYKIITIFGCPGLKAKNRRKDLPRIASNYSDDIIICEEDSYYESFDKIASDIAKNITIKNFSIIEDRDKALKNAVFDLCDNRAVILFLGKGEENTLKRKHGYEECLNDLEIAKKYISLYNKNLRN